jgi:hypothetical protein
VERGLRPRKFSESGGARVEPRFEQLNGRDALVYIVSANLKRRNLTEGQQAMALAMIYPEPGSRTKKDAAKAAESGGFSKSRLKEARSILRHSRGLAESVVKTMKLLRKWKS